MPRTSGKALLPGEEVLAVVGVKPRVRDDRARHAVAGTDLVQPLGLGDLAVAIVLRLDVNRSDDPQARGVAPVVLGQVVALERRVVAEQEIRLGAVGEPGVVIAPEVPEMMVGVDDLEIFRPHGHGHYAGSFGSEAAR